MQLYKKLFISLFFALLLSGCSNPFGQGSLIENISDTISSIFGKTETQLLAGGADKFSTAGAYNGTVSVGNYINQSQQQTNGGYRVITTIK